LKAISYIFFGISLCFLFTAVSGQVPGDTTELVFSENSNIQVLDSQRTFSSFLSSYVVKPMRLTLMHEASFKVKAPGRIMNNRSSVRLEYSKFLLNNLLYLQLDTKLIGYWSDDHQAKPTGKNILFRSRTREAFLQTSFGGTSIKAGYQCLIWGESDVGAITDEVSPRNYSELFFIPLDESRIGQPMLTIDHFSKVGDWSCFLIPTPTYNEYPKPGTAYSSVLLNDVKVPNGTLDINNSEIGMKWKKTFGRSDINIMAASLIDNDYFIKKQRFNMFGSTFNFATGVFLLKGELALKSPKDFYALDTTTNARKVVQKDDFQTSLALEYSPGGNFSASLESVDYHILGWNNMIVDFPKDFSSVVLTLSDKFFHEDLSVNYMNYWTVSYPSFLHVLTASYRWNDHVNLTLTVYYPDIIDKRNHYWTFRDQKQLNFKIQYQF